MPWEFTALMKAPVPLAECPKCTATPSEPALRGMVQSGWRRALGLKYCCLICESCELIVGYEKPPAGYQGKP